ncbi:hypothetical protein JGR64_00260 [Luteimonas sp. MC1572]|uniref:hypothetical protein n=1 Tax=Luteimonas sp. MC1572 TaxID=2799325 RepID=UPI00190C1607|nr:hypothetical protein [Luteimonas sp. MC1572]QQO03254.1 hypothetical protein JGR64_00260 [Luteimonas sp. MC1572]
MAKRIPGLSDEWTDLLTCIFLHMLLPLLPIVFEAVISRGPPSDGTLAITAALYAMAIGLSSENKAMFGLCVLIGVSFSAVYGIISGPNNEQITGVGFSSTVSIGLVFLIHICERYNRHVADCRPFLSFANGGAR